MRRVNQQVQNYKTCLKNSHFGVEKFNFSLGLSFNSNSGPLSVLMVFRQSLYGSRREKTGLCFLICQYS